MHKKKNLLLLIISFLLLTLTNVDVGAKEKKASIKVDYEKYNKEIPLYPKARVYDLKKMLKIRMTMYLTEDKFEKVVNFYLTQLTKKGWQIDFPNELELKIWMEALNSNRAKTPNIMLVLSKPKTKITCNLSIGVVKDKNYAKDLTVITSYISDVVLK